MILDRTDWEVIEDYCVFGYHIGLTLGNQNDINKAPAGIFSNLEIDCCDIGIDIPFYIGDFGVSISNLIIQCDCPHGTPPVFYANNRIGIRSSANNTNSLHITNAEFGIWPYNDIQWSGGRLFLNNANFWANGDGTYDQIAANILGGTALISNCFFDYGFNFATPHLHMAIFNADTGQIFLSGTNLDKDVHGAGIGSNVFSSINTGNVGIGLPNPSVKLEVEDGSDTYLEILKLHNSNNPAGGTHGVGVSFQLSGDYQDFKKAEIRAMASDGYANKIDLAFLSGGSTDTDHQERMRIKAGGNVGIGTTTPGQKLEVYAGAGANGGIAINADTAQNAQIFFNANSVQKAAISYLDGDGTIRVYNSGDRLTITNGGNVGIGVTSPGSKLQVNGNAAIGYSASQAGPTNGLAVNGLVGIGTATPAAKLDVNPGTISNSNPNIRLQGVTSTVPSGGNNGDIQIYESGSTRRLYIKINGTWRYAALT